MSPLAVLAAGAGTPAGTRPREFECSLSTVGASVGPDSTGMFTPTGARSAGVALRNRDMQTAYASWNQRITRQNVFNNAVGRLARFFRPARNVGARSREWGRPSRALPTLLSSTTPTRPGRRTPPVPGKSGVGFTERTPLSATIEFPWERVTLHVRNEDPEKSNCCMSSNFTYCRQDGPAVEFSHSSSIDKRIAKCANAPLTHCNCEREPSRMTCIRTSVVEKRCGRFRWRFETGWRAGEGGAGATVHRWVF